MKKCPFCKGNAKVIDNGNPIYHTKYTGYSDKFSTAITTITNIETWQEYPVYIKCKCGIQTSHFFDRDRKVAVKKSIEFWDKR